MSFPYDAKLPVLTQLYEAPDNRARADILLRCPDNVILKYATPLAETLRHRGFEAGEMFVTQRLAVALAVRDAHGMLPAKLAQDLETMRAALSVYAAGPPSALDIT